METATASAHRAAALTHRLLAFARRQSLDPKSSDVNALVEGLVDILRRTIGERVELEILTSADLWPALADANQLENAILNLAINARDAMPDGGRLIIQTENVHFGAAPNGGGDPGDYIMVSVSDNGSGMPADVVAKAFDPFFTTKPLGQGTGLGLSMVYGFAKQSGGHARIESEVGKGTVVKLYVPRALQARDAKRDIEESHAPAGHGETILVVEDDETVRLLATSALSDLGYRYLEAADAHAAMPHILSSQTIDLLLTDVGLPHLNGRQLAEIARQHRPALKVLFMTGYAEKAAHRGHFLELGMDLISKPFDLDALGSKIREMIES